MTQGELEQLPQAFAGYLSELEMRIMKDIVERIRVNGFSSASADWEISRLQQLGESEENIRKWIRETLQKTDEEVDKIFSDDVYREYYGHERAYRLLGMEQIPFEENQQLQALIEAARSQTKDTFRNMTASTGFAIRNPATGQIMYSPTMEFYQKTLDGAIMDIHSGAFSCNTVLQRTINTLTGSGLRWIDYDSGHHDRVDVAARRAIMTGFRQVQGKINEQVAAELHTDSYEVTYHVGARPTHQPWQGRVWTYQELQTVCGLGSVTGLHGANCYHDYNAFIPGVSVRTYTDEQLDEMITEENTPKEYNGRQYTTYEALQAQRKMERNMRKTRQDIRLLQAGEADAKTVILKKAKYQGQMQTYKDFSKAMKLPEQMDRVYQDGLRGKFTPTKKEQKILEETEKGGIIKTPIIDIEKGTTKLKAAMSEADYKEYLGRLNNHSNAQVKKMYAGYADGISNIEHGQSGYYSPAKDSIVFSYPQQCYIDNGKDKYSTLAHEYGHYFDAKCDFGNIHFNEIDAIHRNTQFGASFFKKCASSSDEFLAAARKDRQLLKSSLTADIKSQLMRHDASDGIQDAIDGLLGERINWGHGDRYYNRRYSNVKSLKDQRGLQAAYKELGLNAGSQLEVKRECRVYEAASEMWANIMSAEVNGGEALEYVRKYLPNSYQAMLDIFEGVT